MRQSIYTLLHTVEAVLLSLQSELLEFLERGNAALLGMLEPRAVFETINHGPLLDILSNEYYVTGKALVWFEWYLKGRTFEVRVGGDTSKENHLLTGVPQGSYL